MPMWSRSTLTGIIADKGWAEELTGSNVTQGPHSQVTGMTWHLLSWSHYFYFSKGFDEWKKTLTYDPSECTGRKILYLRMICEMWRPTLTPRTENCLSSGRLACTLSPTSLTPPVTGKSLTSGHLCWQHGETRTGLTDVIRHSSRHQCWCPDRVYSEKVYTFSRWALPASIPFILTHPTPSVTRKWRLESGVERLWNRFTLQTDQSLEGFKWSNLNPELLRNVRSSNSQ